MANYEYILVRYGELSTKGKNRKDFINKLKTNIKYALKKYANCTYDTGYDRLFIHLNGENGEEISEILKKVFGISSFSLAIRVASDIDVITETVYEMVKEDTGTFKVDTRRHDKLFPMSSDEINRHVATKILKNIENLKVDVHEPDHRYTIEVRKDCTYIMTSIIRGAGGYPVGIGSKAMVMLSGGIDSPVASYLVMKRGVSIECIHFASQPYTSQQALEKVYKLASKLSVYHGSIKVHVINFTELQLAIYEHTDESYAITIMRRMMVRIATGLAKKRGCLALGTGESIGQVASQTLESMSVINDVTNMPIIRPCATMDKLEIIDVSKKIDCYDISIEPYDDCCTIFTPKNPVTKPRLDKCEMFESRWDYQTMVDKCIETAEMHICNNEVKNEDLF